MQGVLLFRHDPFITIDVHGVGYKVYATQDVLSSYHLKDEITLHIHTHVREDSLELYGFKDEQSLELFELLISVNGIGPKTAVGVFAVGNKDQILGAIRKADVDFFTGVPRLGKKNAQKIIIELKNKLGAVEELDLAEGASDVTSALISFGFSMEESRHAIREIGDNGKTTEEKIKLALKQLGR
ncbi:MAG TPA: Holliday junction branch migration protein RuvA [Candidatus Eisenbacteria bacterium]|nr:Holliday junction branch migration protein RuvA [Candidatus Eisenbacteria bacterium]